MRPLARTMGTKFICKVSLDLPKNSRSIDTREVWPRALNWEKGILTELRPPRAEEIKLFENQINKDEPIRSWLQTLSIIKNRTSLIGFSKNFTFFTFTIHIQNLGIYLVGAEHCHLLVRLTKLYWHFNIGNQLQLKFWANFESKLHFLLCKCGIIWLTSRPWNSHDSYLSPIGSKAVLWFHSQTVTSDELRNGPILSKEVQNWLMELILSIQTLV